MFPLQPVGNVSYFWFHAQCFSGESVRVLIIIVLLFHYYLWANSTPDSASYRTHSYCSIVFTVPKWPECHSHVEVMRVCCHVTPPDPLVGSAVCQIITAAQFHHYSCSGRFTFRPPRREGFIFWTNLTSFNKGCKRSFKQVLVILLQNAHDTLEMLSGFPKKSKL